MSAASFPRRPINGEGKYAKDGPNYSSRPLSSAKYPHVQDLRDRAKAELNVTVYTSVSSLKLEESTRANSAID